MKQVYVTKQSLWEKDVFYKYADVVIIGAGIVGLTAALNLVQMAPSMRVCILEKGHLPMGASTRNAGFACFGSISELKQDMATMCHSDVFETLRMRYNGLIEMRKWVSPSLFQYEPLGGYELFTTGQEELFSSYSAEIGEFNRIMKDVLGIDQTYALKDASNFGIKTDLPLIYNQYEGQLHPGKLMVELMARVRKAGVRLLVGMSVSSIQQITESSLRVQCENGASIMCGQIIHATNAFANKLLNIDDVIPVRNQVYVTEKITGLRLKGCFHYDHGYIYLRDVNDRILIGGARNQVDTEDGEEFGTTDEVKQILKDFLSNYILDQDVTFEDKWSGIIATGESKKPIIKRIDKYQIAACRLGGMGVAVGSMVGQKAASLALS